MNLQRNSLHFYFLMLPVVLLMSIPAAAQKDRKKRPAGSVVPASARLAEAERAFTEGEKYFILEDYTKALNYFQRSLELNADNNSADNAAINYKIAEVLSRGNKPDDLLRAAVNIENALADEKKNKYYYILASTIYSGLNNFSQAEQTLETMMQQISGTEEYLYELAALYQYDHKPEEAIKVYNRAESKLGINEVSSLQKQKLYFDLGRTNEAINEGQKLIDANPDDERYVLVFAETLARYKQGPKAMVCLESFLKEHPENGNAKLLLAGLCHDAGQEQKFRELILSVFDDPTVAVADKVSVLSTQIMAYNKVGELASHTPESDNFFTTIYGKLSKMYPKDNTVHTVGGDLFMVLRENDAAEKEYRDAIRYGSANFDAWQNLLTLELQENKFDSIIVHTEMGLELFPNQASLYYFNGYAQLRKKNYHEAVSTLEHAKKLTLTNAPFTSDINGMLGDAYNGAKEYQKSDKAYDEALSSNPDNDLILNNYSYYLAIRKENLEKAEKMASHLIKNNPSNASYLDTYSWVLYMREKYKEARKVMEKAIGTGNVSAVIYEHYGDILFKLGDSDEAVKEWQKSKTMDATNPEIDKKIANRRLY